MSITTPQRERRVIEASLYGVDLIIPFAFTSDMHLRPAAREGVPVRVEPGVVTRRGEQLWASTRHPHVECWSDGEEVTIHWDEASFAVWADGVRVDAADPGVAFERFHNPVMSLLVAARRGVAFHAFAAATPDGAVAVMGSSGSGKSSLGRALVDRGAQLITDDLLVFDDAGRIRPGAEFIRVGTDDDSLRDPGGKRRLHVDAVQGPVELTLVVVVSRLFEEITPLTRPTAAIDRLLNHIYNPAFTHPGQRRRNLAQAARMVRSCRVVGYPRHHLPPDDLAAFTEQLAAKGFDAQMTDSSAEGQS